MPKPPEKIPSVPGSVRDQTTSLATAASMLYSAGQRVQNATFRASRQGVKQLASLPQSVRSFVAGNPIHIDGQTLDPEIQLAMRIDSFVNVVAVGPKNIKEFREDNDYIAQISMGEPIELPSVYDTHIRTRAGAIDCRVYVPVDPQIQTPALVYIHGGGWVAGSIESHDNVCRVLAQQAKVRVLSIAYRLAPETKFPGPLEDCVDAFNYVATHREDFNIVGKIAIGGDSAGANLATAVCLLAREDESLVMPDFQLLIVPPTDALGEYPSRKLFSKGVLLNEADMYVYMNHYLHDESELQNPLVNPMLAPELAGMPPTHVATAGFCPLRDEGEAYAQRLRDAGVDVSVMRHSSMVHPFANLIGFSDVAYTALIFTAGVLYQGLHAVYSPTGDNVHN